MDKTTIVKMEIPIGHLSFMIISTSMVIKIMFHLLDKYLLI